MPTIDQLIRQRSGDHRDGPALRRPPLDPRPGGAGPGRPGGGAGIAPAAGPVPRRPPARQRPRVRLLAGGGRPGRGGPGRRQPHPPGRRAGPGPRPHRVPVPGHRHRLPAAGRRARPGPGPSPRRILVVDDPCGDLAAETTPVRGAARRTRLGAALPRPGPHGDHRDTLGLLLFTSGTSGAPKACLCSQGRLARIGAIVAQMFALDRRRRLLPVHAAVPLQRADGRLGPGAGRPAPPLALRGRFSASGFLPDVRRYGVTYFNYVGQAAVVHPGHARAARRRRQPAASGPSATRDDRGRRRPVRRALRRAPSPTPTARPRAAPRCTRTPDTPPGALGRAPEGTVVARPGDRRRVPTGPLRRARPPAQRRGGHRRAGHQGRRGRLRGLLAQRRGRDRPGCAKAGTGPATWPTATRPGFFYFAGRDHDWLRVDGENFAVGPGRAASCSATPTSCWPRSTPCPTPWSATRSWPRCSCGPARHASTRRASPTSWPRRPTSAPSGRRASCG